MDSLSRCPFCACPKVKCPKYMSSYCMQERLHMEIRRLSLVVGIFPSEESYIRLVKSYLIEYFEEWVTGRSYIRSELVENCRTKLQRVA